MTTISTKQSDIEKKWILIDATDVVVGRLASFIAKRLRGKHLASFTPHVDDGDNVVVVNAEKIHFTGNKLSDKKYYKHTGYPGGIKMQTPEDILSSKFPERILKKAVERMMPSGPLANTFACKSFVYLFLFCSNTFFESKSAVAPRLASALSFLICVADGS